MHQGLEAACGKSHVVRGLGLRRAALLIGGGGGGGGGWGRGVGAVLGSRTGFLKPVLGLRRHLLFLLRLTMNSSDWCQWGTQRVMLSCAACCWRSECGTGLVKYSSISIKQKAVLTRHQNKHYGSSFQTYSHTQNHGIIVDISRRRDTAEFSGFVV